MAFLPVKMKRDRNYIGIKYSIVSLMSSCLRKLDGRMAVKCPMTGKMWLQGYEPSYCCLGVAGRKMVCKFFLCDKCKRAFDTCQELKRHCRKTHPLKKVYGCCEPVLP